VLAHLLDLKLDASSISYVAGWSKADPTVLTAAAAMCCTRSIPGLAAQLRAPRSVPVVLPRGSATKHCVERSPSSHAPWCGSYHPRP
jgi:hypothetical protein